MSETTPIVRVACLQLSPTDVLTNNLAAIARLSEAAIKDGAGLICLPEYCSFLVRSSRRMAQSAAPEASHEVVDYIAALAQRHKVWMLIGSVLTQDEGQSRPVNRSILVSPQGQVVARYDKIHMFDIQLEDGKEVFESAYYHAGTHPVVTACPFGTIGLSICYDVRFPHLYRQLSQHGAEILTIPAAFTARTGAMHWEVLLRARAIENAAYVLAPATVGKHPGEWQTWGHAMIVDPWGKVLAQADGESETYIIADLDLTIVHKARATIPSLKNDVPFDPVVVTTTSL